MANLREVELCSATLRGAEATAETQAQAKSLEGATMPDGSRRTEEEQAEADKQEHVPAEMDVKGI